MGLLTNSGTGDGQVHSLTHSLARSLLVCSCARSTGPAESAYEGGIWRVHVELPESYPWVLNVDVRPPTDSTLTRALLAIDSVRQV
jgi:ubiquitin-protein ligase